jgi:hypothetical protein
MQKTTMTSARHKYLALENEETKNLQNSRDLNNLLF